MKRILLAIVGLLTVSAGAEAQSNDQMIQRALAPLSPREAGSAAVIRFNPDGSYVTLKEGTNAWACYDRSGEPGWAAFSVQCTNVGNLERLAQNRRFAAQAAGDREVLAALVSQAQQNGTRVMPEFGAVWISMDGADQASASCGMTVAVANATAETLPFPTNSRAGGVYLMDAGTTEAHLMVPTWALRWDCACRRSSANGGRAQ